MLAAQRLFITRGFEAATMDAVAQEANVSKLTVYNHFRDKEALFFEAVKAKCEEQLPHALFEGAPRGNVRQQLLTIARGFHALITSPESVAVHRMMAAEAARQQSQIGQLFFLAGPKRTLDELESYLKEANAAGKLEVPDPLRAAGHFFCMIKGVQHMQLLCGCGAPHGPEEVEQHLKSVVDLFLRAYEPRE